MLLLVLLLPCVSAAGGWCCLRLRLSHLQLQRSRALVDASADHQLLCSPLTAGSVSVAAAIAHGQQCSRR
jgi:hypothetical protein